ncbi:MAG TPA: hypothetical protein DCL69_00720, partial [Firmicutes bacterium]|nr:hypothetical protein [Bacillota bacterium]
VPAQFLTAAGNHTISGWILNSATGQGIPLVRVTVDGILAVGTSPQGYFKLADVKTGAQIRFYRDGWLLAPNFITASDSQSNIIIIGHEKNEPFMQLSGGHSYSMALRNDG